jgi:AbrB family looped-hinge helix DNA binding protein
MREIRTKIGEGGRIVIPASYRKSLGVAVGDDLVLVLDEEGVRIITATQAVKRAQQLVRRYIRGGERLSDELLQERRREAERESRRP